MSFLTFTFSLFLSPFFPWCGASSEGTDGKGCDMCRIAWQSRAARYERSRQTQDTKKAVEDLKRIWGWCCALAVTCVAFYCSVKGGQCGRTYDSKTILMAVDRLEVPFGSPC